MVLAGAEGFHQKLHIPQNTEGSDQCEGVSYDVPSSDYAGDHAEYLCIPRANGKICFESGSPKAAFDEAPRRGQCLRRLLN